MARKTLTWKTLNKSYSALSQQFRDAIISKVKQVLKKENGVLLRFNECVFIHFVSENCYADCRGIQLGNDGSLTFQVERHIDNYVDEYDDVLEAMDCASYFEILLALNEKSYSVLTTI